MQINLNTNLWDLLNTEGKAFCDITLTYKDWTINPVITTLPRNRKQYKAFNIVSSDKQSLVIINTTICFEDDNLYFIDEAGVKRLLYKTLKKTPNGCNEAYKDRPYPNNIHFIKSFTGLSNVKLGLLCGVSYTTIANFDRGDRKITDKYKKLIEQATGYQVDRYYE